MSVAEGKRDESRFSLALKAEALAEHTIQITANEKVFLPEYRKAVTDDIINTAKNIYLGIREANDVTVRVGTLFQLEDFKERNRLQREALRNTKRLLYLIDLAHRLFHLKTTRVEYWSKMTINVKNRLHGWIDDDFNRYMPTT